MADRERIDFNQLEKVGRDNDRLERFERKMFLRKKFKLRPPLEVGKQFLILAERLKKKDSPGEF